MAASWVKWMLGAAVGIACLSAGDGPSFIRGASVIAPAHARAGHRLPPNAAGVVRRPHARPVVVRGTIPLNFGYSAGGSAFYGYAPGTYGDVGCYHSIHSGFVCP